MTTPSLQRGLTLLELLITLGILAVIVTMASPRFQTLMESTEKRTALNNLFHGFQSARAEAIRRGHVVTLCPLISGNCSSDWSQNISLFTDPDSNQALSGDETILATIHPPRKGELIPAPASRRYFQFDAIGAVRGTIGNVTYCPASGNSRQIGQIILSMGGRLRFAVDYNGDGNVQKGNGSTITCP
jgi:prepilin-type N-terminal cleavage/methylation domain-containing protein